MKIELLTIIIGLVFLIVGSFILYLNITSDNNKLNDQLGANLKVYTGSILFIIGGIVLIIKELLK
jgi:H+/Cl- antiporter ClcA